MEKLFKNLKYNKEKLLRYGFVYEEDSFVFIKQIVNGQMKMKVKVLSCGNIFSEVVDNSTGEQYVLHLIEGSEGKFIGEIRSEYFAVLGDIAKNCFDKDVEWGEVAKGVIDYSLAKYNNSPEYLWEDLPNFAVLRNGDNKKWYAVLMKIPMNKLFGKSNELIEVLNIKIRNEDLAEIVDNINIFPAYHMNKKYWVTIVLNKNMPLERLFKFIDDSYNLVKK